jgi:hypothetical protein
MRAQVDGVGAGCGYLVAGFLAWERGALVKRRGFYAVPGRWVLTWGRWFGGRSWCCSWWPADQGGTMAAGIAAGIPSAASGPGAAIV